MEKIAYARRDYQSVDDRSLSYAISLKSMENIIQVING